MRTEVESLKNLTGGRWTSVAAKRCDSCKMAAAAPLPFCRMDLASLCLNCDSKIHGVNKLVSRHERVWMCQVCEQAPAVVTCRADAAALCVTCDADIHSANPLARRHDRIPVEPFLDSADWIPKTSPFSFLQAPSSESDGLSSGYGQTEGMVEAGVVSWLLPNRHDHLNSKLGLENPPDTKSGDLFFTDMDPFLDFDHQNSIDDGMFRHQQTKNASADSLVPVQPKAEDTIDLVINNRSNCFDTDFRQSKLSSFPYPAQSLSHSVSSSSLDVGVVGDGNTMSDISCPFGLKISNVSDPSAAISASTGAKQAAQSSEIDREARVLRYRERRKNRKFEKTIRYASRKAYAETRPRIKGRFAKRADIDSDFGCLYNPASVPFVSDDQCGVVPSL
uniref:Zinc finger protein CONSTANS-LIKE 5 n=1 Tax=Rhizophora mucronata TaxID=61149 RepID=A0A2P2MHL1_RHIMU